MQGIPDVHALSKPELSILILFTFGSTIFYVLLLIERKVWRLLSSDGHAPLAEADVRFVHKSLKHLIPVLPPSNGVVVVGGFAAIVWQGVQLGWSWQSSVFLCFWIVGQTYIIVFGRIAAAIKDVRDTASDAPIDSVARGVRQLVRQHRNGLMHALGVLILQVALITLHADYHG